MSSPQSPGRDPVRWFDASSLLRLRNHTPVGLTRVESHVLRGALELPELMPAFGRFNRHSRCFESVPREKIEKLLAGFGVASQHATGKPKRSGRLTRWGRQLESRARKLLRGPLQSTMSAMTGRSKEADLQAGDSLIISGSTWDNFDPRWLEQLASQRAVKINCILADMIPWKFPHQFHDTAAVQHFLDFAEVLARYGNLVACISRSTQSDFQEFSRSLGIARDATEVILLGADLPNTASPLEGLPDDLLTRGFILSVSTIQVRKNQQLLYNLWRRFAEEQRHAFPRLVLVGANGWLTEELRKQINSDPLTKDSILVLNRVGDSHLQWLYQNCRFTLYPSLYEGWGLPIVESLQHGKACIASNTSSMPEASQNLAVHLDPHDFVSWHEWIVRWTSNHASLSAFEETIARQFRARSWNRFAQEFFSRILTS